MTRVCAVTKMWKNSFGQFHKEGGPAIEYSDGAKTWYRHGQLHREDGPAFIDPTDGTQEWWLDDVRYNSLEWMLKVHELNQEKNS